MRQRGERASTSLRAKLNQAFNQALQSQKVRDRFRDMDLTPEGGSPERFGAYIRAEQAKWKSTVSAAGITVKWRR